MATKCEYKTGKVLGNAIKNSLPRFRLPEMQTDSKECFSGLALCAVMIPSGKRITTPLSVYLRGTERPRELLFIVSVPRHMQNVGLGWATPSCPGTQSTSPMWVTGNLPHEPALDASQVAEQQEAGFRNSARTHTQSLWYGCRRPKQCHDYSVRRLLQGWQLLVFTCIKLSFHECDCVWKCWIVQKKKTKGINILYGSGQACWR